MFAKIRKAFVRLGALFAAGAGSAMAALPEGFTEAVTEMQTDAVGAINSVWPAVKTVLVAAMVIAAIWLIYRQIRKALGR